MKLSNIIKDDEDYENYYMLPDGMTYEKGILGLNHSKGVNGFAIKDLLRIDNQENGTKANLCLEDSTADYQIKKSDGNYVSYSQIKKQRREKI